MWSADQLRMIKHECRDDFRRRRRTSVGDTTSTCGSQEFFREHFRRLVPQRREAEKRVEERGVLARNDGHYGLGGLDSLDDWTALDWDVFQCGHIRLGRIHGGICVFDGHGWINDDRGGFLDGANWFFDDRRRDRTGTGYEKVGV